MRSRPYRRGTRAFSLVEVCFALALMAAVLMPLLGLMANGMVQVNSNIDNVQSVNIAQQVFTAIHHGNFSSLAVSGSATTETSPTTKYYFTAEGDSVPAGTSTIVYTAVVTCATNAVATPTPPMATLVLQVRRTPGGHDVSSNRPVATFLDAVSCKDLSGFVSGTD